MSENFLFVDLETTGLSARTDTILEIAAIVTNADFEEIDRFHRYVCPPHETDRVVIGKWAAIQHAKSGLLVRALEEGGNIVDVQQAFVDFLLRQDLPNLIPAGSNPTFDREFIWNHMPQVTPFLHKYRTLDASSLYRIAGGGPPGVAEVRAHTAIADIEEDLHAAQQARLVLKAAWDV